MDFAEFQILLMSNSKFSYLQNNPQLMKDTLNKIAIILRSGKLRDEAMNILNNQKDLPRYTAIAKRIAGLTPQDKPWKKSLVDTSLQDSTDDEIINTYEDDARAFYYKLDVLTGGKHAFYEKIDKKLAVTKFKRGIARSGVGSHIENGKTIWHINVDCAPLINNRTVTMHELWHAIDEKNLNHDTSIMSEQDQFIGEIGTLFIDMLSYDYMLHAHSDEQQLIEGLKYLKSNEWNNDIIKGKEAYLDILCSQAIYGESESVRNNAQQEILDGFGKVFGPNMLARQIDKLYQAATNSNAHFDPMYELRYVVGKVVSDAVYNQDISVSEKLDKMAQLNDNVKTLNGIKIQEEQSPIDAVTDFLGVDRVEVLVENYAQQMIQNRQNQTFHTN